MNKREEVYKATLEYFKGDELAASVFIDKYCLKQGDKYFELTPNDMHQRLAKEFSRIEQNYPNSMSYEEIFNLLKDFKYLIPQGSPMAGIGNNFVNTSISNCFVLGDHADSYGGIMKADEEQAQLMKRRGGVGQDISYIRPSGSIANDSPLGPNAGTTLYMDRFSNTTREVQQDGRRGALMLSISINHPDAEKFIDKKMTPGQVTGANVSVKITDEFMKCLADGTNFVQTFPIDYDWKKHTAFTESLLNGDIKEDVLYSLIDSDGMDLEDKGCYAKLVDPKKIWDKIVYNAWASAEPGILFWDTILRESPAADYGPDWEETSTNPCGEIPLPPYDSCRLLAINLYSYVENPFTNKAFFDYGLFSEHVNKAQRLMDDIVDLEIEKIDRILAKIQTKEHPPEYQQVETELWLKIRKKAVEGRRTGLGVLGEADMLAAIGIRYGTKEATKYSKRLHQVLATRAYESSIRLAKERGCFPIWSREDGKSEFLKRMFSWDNDPLDYYTFGNHVTIGRRNIGLLTIAPTGSTSLLTQTTSGIEPLFAPYYFRKKRSTIPTNIRDDNGDYWEEFIVFHRPFVKWYGISITNNSFDVTSNENFEQSEEILKLMTKKGLQKIFESSPYYKATAQDVDYIEKVRMQGAIQKWVDHSISVTVNMPESVTKEIVADVYRTAYEEGCKGITVYRENSRGNVLSLQSSKNDEENDEFTYVSAVKRPKITQCDVFFKTSRKEEFIVFVGKVHNKPYEIFAVPYNEKTRISKRVTSGTIEKGGKGNYHFESTSGRHKIENITQYMIETEQNETRSISGLLRHRVNPKFIARMLAKFATISSFHKVMEKVIRYYDEDIEGQCPECGSNVTMTDGCMKCMECGYSKCG